MRWEEAQAVVGEPCPACGQPGEIDWKETTTLLDRESQFTQGATACRTDGCPLKGQWVRSGDRANPLTPADFARAVDMVYALDVTRRHMFGWVMSPDVHARWRRYGPDQENKEAGGTAPFVFDPGRPQPARHLIGLPIRVVDGVDLQALEWRTA